MLSDVFEPYVVGRVGAHVVGGVRGRPRRDDSDPRRLQMVQLSLNVIIVCKRVYGLMLIRGKKDEKS